eukprot:1692543-Amphidinium_carterae.1
MVTHPCGGDHSIAIAVVPALAAATSAVLAGRTTGTFLCGVAPSICAVVQECYLDPALAPNGL